MKRQVLASESFSLHNRHYFLDFKRAANDSNYIQITVVNNNQMVVISGGM